MGVLQEFKEFAVKGNVVDMSVGIVIGGAFTPIARSLVDDLLMPPIGLLLGEVDFSQYRIVLREASVAADGSPVPAVALSWGHFVNVVVTFLVVAWVVFLLVKVANRMRREHEAPPATTRACPRCLMSIPLAARRCGHCTSEL